MNKARPSNVVIRIVMILILMSMFVIGSLIYHASQQAKESDEGIGSSEQELLN